MDTFEYEITIPESTALITIKKAQIVEDIENRVGRVLSEEQRTSVWDKFRQSDEFYDAFAEYFREQGIPCQGAHGLNYNELFKNSINKAIQDTVDQDFSNYWEDLFGNSLDEIADDLKDNKDEITWDNIESHSQSRIQDENVKNGLARCQKELKKTSVKKWRENYVNTHIINSSTTLPKGKNNDELIKIITSYLS